MLYYANFVGKSQRDRVSRAMGSSFKDFMKRHGGLSKPTETWNALINGGGRAIVEDGNWSGYDSRVRTNEAHRENANTEFHYDKPTLSGDGEASTDSLQNYVSSLKSSEWGDSGSCISGVDLSNKIDNVRESVRSLSRVFVRRYAFGLKAFSFGILSKDPRTIEACNGLRESGCPVSGARVWSADDVRTLLEYVQDLIDVAKGIGVERAVCLVEQTKVNFNAPKRSGGVPGGLRRVGR